MKKLLFVLLSSALIFTNAFAAYTSKSFSRPISIQEALSQKLTDNSWALTVINLDITHPLIAYYSVSSACTTPFDGNGPQKGEIMYRSASAATMEDPLPVNDPVCLYDAASGQIFFNQTVPVPAMISAYADSGTWQVNVTPVH